MSRLNTPTRRRLAKGAFWGTLGSIAARLITLGVSFFLARTLGKDVFGEYGVINSTVGMVGGFAGLGLGMTVTKYVSELKARDPERAGRIVGLSSMVAWLSSVIYGIVFILLAPWLAEKTLAAPQLTSLLRISSITLIFSVINSVQTSALSGLEAFKINSLLTALCSAIQAVLVAFSAWKWGLTGAVTAMAISMTFTVVATFFTIRNELNKFKIRVLFKEAKKEWEILFRFSLPNFLSGLSTGPVLWGCNAFLANQPGGYSQLGIYNAANQWYWAVLLLPNLVGSAVLPVMSDKFGAGDKAGIIRVMKGMIGITAIIVVPTSIILTLCGHLILKGYGASFSDGYLTLAISVCTASLTACVAPVGQFIAANNKMWIGFWMNTGWGLVFIVAAWFCVQWGAAGLASARLVAYVFHTIWSYGVFRYLTNVSRNKTELRINS